MDFRTIPPSSRPNRWLICPPGYANLEPDAVPPVFGVAVPGLREAWRAQVQAAPRVRILRDQADGMELVQRTPILRFADDVAVAYIELARSRSTIALFSRSRVGWSDLGVNRRRLQRWLARLGAGLPAAPSV